MSQFKSDEHGEEVELVNLAFTKRLQKSLAKNYDIKCTMVDEKSAVRYSIMIDSINQSVEEAHSKTGRAVKVIVLGQSALELLISRISGQRLNIDGVSICPNCLDAAIVFAEDYVANLKDLRELIKQHAV